MLRPRTLLLAAALAGTAARPGFAGEGPIQDNSFLVEEAYNQEAGVVQHIATYLRSHDAGDWTVTFTQEWPLRGQRHQLSYGLLYLDPGEPAGGHGFGDVSLNYRFQWLGGGDATLAFAPRFSVLAPTGDWRDGEGAGGVGAQLNLPLSLVLGRHFVTHVNAGATHIWNAKSDAAGDADLTVWNAGGSLVWLAQRRVNGLLELVWARGESVAAGGGTERFETSFLNPGIRWAHDRRNGLQIVPGVAMPIGIGASHGERAVFVYLSFEHPFGSARGSP